jgi:hypothetical protein
MLNRELWNCGRFSLHLQETTKLEVVLGRDWP